MNSQPDTATRTGGSPPATGTGDAAGTERAGLNDVMIAMDVVDTLRHDKNLVERELNDDARRRDLIERLREIYAGQGIEVPDRILEEGVRALEEDRFTYTPPNPSKLSTQLARLYVTRWSWGRYVLGIAAGIIAFLAVNYLFVERPRIIAEEARLHELNVELPGEFERLEKAIQSEAQDEAVKASAGQVATVGRNAAKAGDVALARTSRAELQDTLERLRQVYEIRVVNRQGEVSGLWRIPQANPGTYNFYVVVEAIGPDGKAITRSITNEETGKREKVTTWAQRVDRQVLVDVKADKEDDGIIQKAIVGRKVRGKLEPDWTIPVQGGAITRWE